MDPAEDLRSEEKEERGEEEARDADTDQASDARGEVMLAVALDRGGTPSGTPMTVAISNPRNMSSKVIGSASSSTVETGSVLRSETPRSPWRTPLIQRQYCSG